MFPPLENKAVFVEQALRRNPLVHLSFVSSYVAVEAGARVFCATLLCRTRCIQYWVLLFVPLHRARLRLLTCMHTYIHTHRQTYIYTYKPDAPPIHRRSLRCSQKLPPASGRTACTGTTRSRRSRPSSRCPCCPPPLPKDSTPGHVPCPPPLPKTFTGRGSNSARQQTNQPKPVTGRSPVLKQNGH